MFLCFSISIYGDVSDYMLLPVPKRLDTKEDLIKMDVQTMYQNERQDTIARNIYLLELALVMPFEDPIKALVRITSKQQYEKYKYAIEAHLHQRLADQYLQYGRLFYKENIYFYTTDYYKEYLLGYDIAEFYFRSARIYRQRAENFAEKARAIFDEINPDRDQCLIDLDQKVYLLTNNPFDFEAVYTMLLEDLEKNRALVKEAHEST